MTTTRSGIGVRLEFNTSISSSTGQVRRMPRNGNGKMKQAFSNIYLRIRHICHSVHEKETSINHNEGLTDISLPKLEYSGVLAVYLNPDLKTFNSGITHVGSIPPRNQRLYKPRFTNNTFHASTLPRLAHVNGSFTINQTPVLYEVSFPRLQIIYSDLTVTHNPRLLNFAANALKTAASIRMLGKFSSVEFFSLREVTGGFSLTSDDASMDCFGSTTTSRTRW
jgi:hypothetical protein